MLAKIKQTLKWSWLNKCWIEQLLPPVAFDTSIWWGGELKIVCLLFMDRIFSFFILKALEANDSEYCRVLKVGLRSDTLPGGAPGLLIHSDKGEKGKSSIPLPLLEKALGALAVLCQSLVWVWAGQVPTKRPSTGEERFQGSGAAWQMSHQIETQIQKYSSYPCLMFNVSIGGITM